MNRGFHEHGPPGTRHLNGLAQPIRGACGLDNPVIGSNGQSGPGDLSGNARPLGDAQLGLVAPELMHAMPRGLKNLCHQETQLAIAEDSDFRTPR